MNTVDRAGIASLAPLLAPYVRRTPVLEIDAADVGCDLPPVTLKLELLQRTGSFKARGAFANLLRRDIPAAGVAAASGGNHGAAVAYAAMKLGVQATIFVPRIASPPKIERIRRYGATLVVEGERYADALAACERWRAETGAMGVHAFDGVDTIMGQGTVGLEIENQVPGVHTVLVAVGGGGLIGGVSAWFDGQVRMIAVEPEGAPTLARALEAGRPVDTEAGSIAADALAPRRVGELTFPLAQRFVDRVVLVSDADIAAAQEALWRGATIVAEPGGAAAFAALLSGRYVPAAGERVCVVVSGGNTAAVHFS